MAKKKEEDREITKVRIVSPVILGRGKVREAGEVVEVDGALVTQTDAEYCIATRTAEDVSGSDLPIGVPKKKDAGK